MFRCKIFYRVCLGAKGALRLFATRDYIELVVMLPLSLY